MLQLLDGLVLQLLVTAQFYLESKGKHILKVWGNVDPYVFPPPGPALCKLG